MSFPNRTAELQQFAALPESGERNSPMHSCAREHSSNTNFNGPRRESPWLANCYSA